MKTERICSLVTLLAVGCGSVQVTHNHTVPGELFMLPVIVILVLIARLPRSNP